jgi:hypothetical protein
VPDASPAVFDRIAAAEARARRAGGARSTIAAVAVPVTSPAESPETRRPTSRTVTSPARRNRTSLTAAAARAATSTGRRPTESDSAPKPSSPPSTPTAYTAKITVIISVENAKSARQIG